MKQILKDVVEKIFRNWYLIGGVSLLFVAPKIHNALAETILHYVGIMFLATATANLLIHAFTVIKWRDWKGNQEFEIVGKCVVMGAIFFGCAFVAGSMFQQESQTTTMEVLNEEIALKDSTTAQTIDSLKTVCDTLPQ